MGKNLIEGERTWTGEISIFDFDFPNMTDIKLTYKIKGRVNVGINYDSNSNLRIHLDTTLYANAAVRSGFGKFSYITAGAKGTFLSGDATGIFYDRIITNGHFSAGKTLAYVEGKDLENENFYHEFEVYQGWERVL